VPAASRSLRAVRARRIHRARRDARIHRAAPARAAPSSRTGAVVESFALKAVVFKKYGPPDVLRLREVPKPVPADGEILVRVHATTVSSGDARLRALRVPRGLKLPVRVSRGFFGPRQPILGFDLAGEVEDAGRSVETFMPGDRVIGSVGFQLGCHAEYRCLPAGGTIAAIPDGIGYDEAVAACFGGATALYFLERGNLRRGERIVVNGASGAVGTMAVQLAKHVDAEVTGVCSARNVELVRSLGADHVVDYGADDFTRNGETYDVIMDTVGNAPYARVRGSLKPGGRFLMVIGDLVRWFGVASSKQSSARPPRTRISSPRRPFVG
jgi:NADPH:quinone reductase-like Zn-dependent oxidoreductase